MEDTCRSCLRRTPKKYTLTGKLINLQVTIADMLEYCTSNKLDLSENLPSHVCTFCFRTIRMAYEFFKQFDGSQSKLQKLKSGKKAAQLGKKSIDFQSYSNSSTCPQSAQTGVIEIQNCDKETENKETESEYEIVDTIEVNIDDIKDLQVSVDEVQNSMEVVSYQKYVCDSDYINTKNNFDDKEDIFIDEQVHISNDQYEGAQHANFVDILETDVANTELYKECELSSNMDVPSTDLEFAISIKNNENKNEKLYPFICPICSLKYSRVDIFFKHISHHKQDIIICSRCQAKPEYELDEYIEHYKEFHKLQCEKCNKKMTSYFGYSYHMKQHINNSCYKCPIKDCQRSFVLRGLLRRHIKNHYEPPVFECHLCPSKFNHRDTLRYHVKKHLNKKDHLCTICGRTFYIAGHLTHHMNSHLGNKRFACSICEKRFITNTCLKRHVAICSKKHSFVVTDYGLEEVVEND